MLSKKHLIKKTLEAIRRSRTNEKNPESYKGYTDVNKMMKELLQ